jgi:hypothetical protein
MQTESQPTPSASFGLGLMHKLVPVHPSIKGLSDIRRAQLMMCFSLVIGLTCLSAAVSSFFSRNVSSSSLVTFVLSALGLCAYGLGRTRYYKWGAWLLVVGMAAAGYLLFARSTSPMPAMDLFIMLPMSLILASGLLSVGEQIAFLFLNVALLAILPLLVGPGKTEAYYAGIMLALGILLIVISVFRNRLEEEQFAELNFANRELNIVKDNLEELVRAGTETADKARSETAAALFSLQEQAWFLNAQVSVADALRGEQDLPTLTNRAMQALCSELKSPVGAFFLFTENQLKFTGGFAFLPNEQNPILFQLGEGLVGQAAVDRRKFFLKNIPAGYFEIVSGLGNTLPNQLAILPCMQNRQLVGVIELGLLSGLSQLNLQFIDAAVESISIAVQTAYDRQRISELLAETQAQAEELQSREEELRAINEELESQAENLRDVSSRAS